MSTVAVAVLLGLLLMLLLRTNQLRLGSALVAVIFGLVLASTPAGPTIEQGLGQSGAWVWGQVRGL